MKALRQSVGLGEEHYHTRRQQCHAEGYVIELAERYSTEPDDNEEKDVIMLDISFLLTAITYVGENDNLKHDFVNLYS